MTLEFLESLAVPAKLLDRIQIRNPSEKTCDWLWRSEEYRSWRRPGSHILHILGKAGSGKSVLAKLILETLGTECEGIAGKQVLYYFCNNRNRPDENASFIVTFFIHQLLSDRQSLIDRVLKDTGITYILSSSKSPSPWSFESLWSIFETALNSSKLDEIYCVIDGLDESDRASTREFLSRLPGLLRRVPARRSLKFVLTSRTKIHTGKTLQAFYTLIQTLLVRGLRPTFLKGLTN